MIHKCFLFQSEKNQSASGLHRSKRLVAEIVGGAGGVAAARAAATVSSPLPPSAEGEATEAEEASLPRPPLRTAYRIALDSVATLLPWPCSSAWTRAKARSPPSGGREEKEEEEKGRGAAEGSPVAVVASLSPPSSNFFFLVGAL